VPTRSASLDSREAVEIRRLEKESGIRCFSGISLGDRGGLVRLGGLEGSTRLEVVFRGCGFTACGMNASCTNKTLL
jgi:hypothetical protein